MAKVLLLIIVLSVSQVFAGTLETETQKGTVMSAEIDDQGDVKLLALTDNKNILECIASHNELKLRNMSSTDFVFLALNFHSNIQCETPKLSKLPRFKRAQIGKMK